MYCNIMYKYMFPNATSIATSLSLFFKKIIKNMIDVDLVVNWK